VSIRQLYYSLPLVLRKLVRKLYYLPKDLPYYFNSTKDAMIPPKGKMNIGDGDFILQGKHHLHLLKKHLNIKVDQSMLDIGCGYGRTAVALTKYLNSTAQYDGLDILSPSINWCNQRIHKEYNNFNFHLHDDSNELYNKKSKTITTVLPFEANQFDHCFLFSVFTHMLPDDIDKYLLEIHRVLKSDGGCLISMFIYDDVSESNILESHNGHRFLYLKDGYRIMNQKVITANVAYHQQTALKYFDMHQFEVVSFIEGYWKEWIDKSDKNSFQDMFILKNK